MNLNIQAVTPETVEVQGQTVTRAFAEGVMLSGLIAGAGRNSATQEAIVTQYLDAGLSAAVFPKIVRAVKARKVAEETERGRLRAEAEANAERFRSYATLSPLDVARRRAAREARERKYQAMSQAVRGANGSGSWSSSEF
ncbi:hypothetical protein [Pseudomonas putida]|uniref:hypothetical protein n=1 Tax=Pseudomonas putida TaxID=303 RepID=UPI001623289B|nr:hypothetical protein [Pseudomonas putida]QNG10080.1 hypothetical protein GPM17_17310 [Pseudomonas putida]HDS1057812.1 hypothetical protein [Pseudomonas putida]